VALKTHKPDFLPDQHAGVRRTMRLMTRTAAFELNSGVLKGEWTALVAVTGKATRLGSSEGLQHRGTDASMRIVAIDTRHRAFRQLMVTGALELRPYI
jgi:hypothetical protein